MRNCVLQLLTRLVATFTCWIFHTDWNNTADWLLNYYQNSSELFFFQINVGLTGSRREYLFVFQKKMEPQGRSLQTNDTFQKYRAWNNLAIFASRLPFITKLWCHAASNVFIQSTCFFKGRKNCKGERLPVTSWLWQIKCFYLEQRCRSQVLEVFDPARLSPRPVWKRFAPGMSQTVDWLRAARPGYKHPRFSTIKY